MKKNLWSLAADLSVLLPKREEPKAEEPKEPEEPENLNADKSVQVKKTVNRHAMRRVLSELALEKELPWHFEQGVSYHCISFGDVDALTYLRCIVKQQRLKYCLLSTWCMASEDIREIPASEKALFSSYYLAFWNPSRVVWYVTPPPVNWLQAL